MNKLLVIVFAAFALALLGDENLGTDPVRPLILLAIAGLVPKNTKNTVMGVNCRLLHIGNDWQKMERMDTEAV